MVSTRVLELVQIFLIYSVTIIGLGEIISRPFTRGKGISYRFIADLIVGNFYAINLTFLLAFLKLFIRPVIIVVFLLGAILVRFLFDREKMASYWYHKYELVVKFLRREYGERNALKTATETVKGHFFSRMKRLLAGRGIEVLLLAIAMGINVYYFSYQAINFVSYAAPDVEVHLYWIQSLVGGELFPAGVYPFGMHCIGAALCLIYDIPAVVFARMFGVVTSFYIMLLCYIFVKSICKQKYAPILGFMIYTIANLTVGSSFIRYSAMISQEYAMIFLCPMMIFLYRYLNEKKKQDLVLFGMSVSLTLAVHFYITAIALFFCLAVGIVYLARMIKRKMLVPILVCGVTSITVAILPLAIALLLGYPLEQSFRYGASVLLNDSSLYGDSEETEEESTDEEEQTQNGTVIEKPATPEEYISATKEHLDLYVFTKTEYIWIFVIPIFAVVLNWLIRLWRKNVTDQCLIFLSLVLYILILFEQTIASAFDFLVIIEPKRMGIFLAYSIPVVIAIFLDIIYVLIPRGNKVERIWNAGVLVCLIGLTAYIYENDMEKPLPQVYYFQTKGAMEVSCDIIKNYDKYSWTIVSPVNETSIVYNQGYHYEIVDMLKQLEHYREGMELYIPTEYVFFYIEKMPIELYGYAFDVTDPILYQRESISKEAAIAEYSGTYKTPEKYYQKERLKVMSRMYYWAQKYLEYFPDEMTVYYEDEEIVVYRLKQNIYALNNLAINYREGLLNEQE